MSKTVEFPFGPAVPPRPVPTLSGGRPRTLDGESKRAIAILVAEGFTLTQAAAYMACDRKTIYNERRRDEHFDFNLKRAKAMRDMEPLNVIRRAAQSSWRAAAWLLKWRKEEKKERRAARAKRRELAARKSAVQAANAPAVEQPATHPTPPATRFSPQAFSERFDAALAKLDSLLETQAAQVLAADG